MESSSRIDPNQRAGLPAGSTLAVVLGASEWPEFDGLIGSTAFSNSARDLVQYFLASYGLGLAADHVLDLFDDDSAASLQNRRIGHFLKEHRAALLKNGSNVTDLLVVYIGHGGFVPNDRDSYFLALRSTQTDAEGVSGYRVSDLAKTITDSVRYVRRYLIFDCCFSASAYSSFQSTGPLEVARINTLDAFPRRGTALLCSSGSRDPSKALKGKHYTMFSEALLTVLRDGSPFHTGISWLSLKDVGDAVREIVRDHHPDKAVRPEVHSPDQREGDIAELALFRNPSFIDTGTDAHGVHFPESPEVTATPSNVTERQDAQEPFDDIASLIVALGDYDSSVAESAGRRLAAIGAAALPSLRGALSDSRDWVLLAAVWTLGLMGEGAAGARDGLLQVFHNREGDLQLASAEALLASNASSDLPIEVVGEALRSGVASVRRVALRDLQKAGALAIPHLCRALAHRDSVPEVISVLEEMGGSIDGASVVEMLRSLAALLQSSSGVLVNGLLSGASFVRMIMPEACLVRDLIAEWLPRYGAICLPGILELLPFSDGRGHVAKWALELIDAVPQAIKALQGRALDMPVRVTVTVRLLEKLGPRSVPELRRIAKHAKSADVRAQATRSLENLEEFYVSFADRVARTLLLVIIAPLGVLMLPYGVARMRAREGSFWILAAAGCIGIFAGIVVAIAAVGMGVFSGWIFGFRSTFFGLICSLVNAAAVYAASDIYGGILRIKLRWAKPVWWEFLLQGALVSGAGYAICAELVFHRAMTTSLFGALGGVFGAALALWPLRGVD